MNSVGELAIAGLAIAVGYGIFRAAERKNTVPRRDWGYEMQAAAERHLEACNDALFEEDNGVESESPALAPYCGCDTCVVREVLFASWPLIQDMVLDLSHHSDIVFEVKAKHDE